MISKIAGRYGKALFTLAREQGEEERVLEDLQWLEQCITGSASLQALIHNPLIRGEVKAKIMTRISKNEMSDLSCRFVDLLCRKRRCEILRDIIKRYEEYVLELKGIIRSNITSAVALDSEQIEKIKKRISRLTGKTIRLEQEINRDLIGGFIIKLEDTVIDLSVRGQLESLRKQLVFGS